MITPNEPTRILVVNLRPVSTKVAIFDENKMVYLHKIIHPASECQRYENIIDQYDFWKEAILKELRNAEIDVSRVKAVVGRGGLVKPLKSGVYEVNEQLKYDLIHNPSGQDSVNLGALLADDLAQSIPGARAFIVDPIVVDEMDEIARIGGHPLFPENQYFMHSTKKLWQKNMPRAFSKIMKTLTSL